MYHVVIVHEGEDEWAEEVETQLRRLTAEILKADDVLVRHGMVADALVSSESTAVVCLASEATARSDSIAAELGLAREAAVPVVPFVRVGDNVAEVLPPAIRQLNAVRWESDEPALAVLELLGIAERDRRLFLSYRQSEFYCSRNPAASGPVRETLRRLPRSLQCSPGG